MSALSIRREGAAMKSHISASRSGTLDSLRGLTLVSMIAYHTCWDLVYLYGFD